MKTTLEEEEEEEVRRSSSFQIDLSSFGRTRRSFGRMRLFICVIFYSLVFVEPGIVEPGTDMVDKTEDERGKLFCSYQESVNIE